MERTRISTPTDFFPLAFGTQTTVAWVDTSHQVDINKCFWSKKQRPGRSKPPKMLCWSCATSKMADFCRGKGNLHDICTSSDNLDALAMSWFTSDRLLNSYPVQAFHFSSLQAQDTHIWVWSKTNKIRSECTMYNASNFWPMLSCTHKKQHMYCLPYINCESLGLNSSLPCNVWSNFWDVLLVYGIGNTTLAKSSSFLPNQSTCTPFTWKCQTRNPLCTTPTYPRSLGEVREGRICENPWDPSRTNTSDVVRWHQCGWMKSFGRWPLPTPS